MLILHSSPSAYRLSIRLLTRHNGRNSLERLSKEPDILNAEARRVKQQMQDLALANYKTFISTNECIHDVRLEVHHAFCRGIETLIIVQMINIGRRLDQMTETLPKFSDECQNFCTVAQNIATRRATNRLTMQYHSQLLEVDPLLRSALTSAHLDLGDSATDGHLCKKLVL